MAPPHSSRSSSSSSTTSSRTSSNSSSALEDVVGRTKIKSNTCKAAAVDPRQSTLQQFFSRATSVRPTNTNTNTKTAASTGARRGFKLPEEEDDEEEDDEDMMEVSLSSLAMLPSVKRQRRQTTANKSVKITKEQEITILEEEEPNDWRPVMASDVAAAAAAAAAATAITTTSSSSTSCTTMGKSTATITTALFDDDSQNNSTGFVDPTTHTVPTTATTTTTTKGTSSSSDDSFTTTTTLKVRQAAVPSIRRIVSHSAMEFIPPCSTTATKSFHERLMQRSTTIACRPWSATCLVRPLSYKGETTTATTAATTERNESSKRSASNSTGSTPGSTVSSWQSPRWVELVSGSHSKIEHMAWDPLGVLLAVALANRQILIYDWDTVRAADQRGKAEWQRAKQQTREWRRRQRNCSDAKISKNNEITTDHIHEEATNSAGPPPPPPPSPPSTFSLPPMLQFTVAQSISCLQWNPYNPDELAVGFKVQGYATHIYQLDRIVEWQEQRQRQRQRNPSHNSWNNASNSSSLLYPPPTTYTLLQPPSVAGRTTNNNSHKNGSVTAIVFAQPHEHENFGANNTRVIVSVGHAVYCWKLLLDPLDESASDGREDANTTTSGGALFQWRYLPPSPCTCVTTPLPPSQTKTMATTTAKNSSEDSGISDSSTVSAVVTNDDGGSSTLSSWIVLVTQAGHFLLLDYTRTTKERAAFSLQDKPVVIHEDQTVVKKHSSYGSVVALQVSQVMWRPPIATADNTNNKKDGAVVRAWLGQLTLTWVTAGGWVLQNQLEFHRGNRAEISLPTVSKKLHTTKAKASRPLLLGNRTNRSTSNNSTAPPPKRPSGGLFSMTRKSSSTKTATSSSKPSSSKSSRSALPAARSEDSRVAVSTTSSSIKVVYAPSKVQLYNAEGIFMGQDASTYSVPRDRIHAHIGSNMDWMVWPETPTMSKYLAHHDKYVLDNQPKIVRETERTIRFFDTRNGSSNETTTGSESSTTVRIGVKALPQVMALHPGLEWLVLGVGNRLVLLANRE